MSELEQIDVVCLQTIDQVFFAINSELSDYYKRALCFVFLLEGKIS